MSLVSALGTALSGLNAAATQMNVAASNIANMSSRGYQAQRVNLTNAPGGGVQVASMTTDTSPGSIDADGQEGSNVDPAKEMVDMSLAKFSYAANAMVVKAVDQMTGTLLDIKH